jgi:hypothetical protein
MFDHLSWIAHPLSLLQYYPGTTERHLQSIDSCPEQQALLY